MSGGASEGISLSHSTESHNISSLYLILSKNIENLKLNIGIGNGKNPYLLSAGGMGYYNLNGYFTYASIEREIGKVKIFLETNKFTEDFICVIGSSYKVKKFLFKLTSGIVQTKKVFEIPDNSFYYLMPMLTIEYNKRKGD